MSDMNNPGLEGSTKEYMAQVLKAADAIAGIFDKASVGRSGVELAALVLLAARGAVDPLKGTPRVSREAWAFMGELTYQFAAHERDLLDGLEQQGVP